MRLPLYSDSLQPPLRKSPKVTGGRARARVSADNVDAFGVFFSLHRDACVQDVSLAE